MFYRGPKGVWTLQKQGKKPKFDMDFNDAKPTITHMAIKSLVSKGLFVYNNLCFNYKQSG